MLLSSTVPSNSSTVVGGLEDMPRDFIISRHDLHIPEKNALKIMIRIKVHSLILPILKLYLYLANPAEFSESYQIPAEQKQQF